MTKAKIIKSALQHALRMFFNCLSHIGKKYYYGRMVCWLLEDKKGKGVYCNECGNIANGIKQGRVLGFIYRIPLCKKHNQIK